MSMLTLTKPTKQGPTKTVFSISKKISILIFSACIYAIGFNFFLVPANVYGSGFTGISQLIMNIAYKISQINIPMGFLLLSLNIPIMLLAWKKIGKSFMVYSLFSVFFMSLFLNIIPVYQVTDDILLNAVFGGSITAIGIGLTLRYGASTGGMDIIAYILSKINGKPFGRYTFALNAVIVLCAGYLFGWEKSLYTIVTLYASSHVIDLIHTRYVKLTAMIITKDTIEMKKRIIDKLHHGVTVVPAKGAFSNEDKEMLITVISKYQLFELKQIIKEVDAGAFTNIVQTEDTVGRFRRD